MESKSSEKATSWTVSPANSSFLLVTFFYLPHKEMSFTLASAFILLLPLTKFLLTPLTCPAPAELPSTNCLLLSCYMYSIILFWFFSPSAHLLRSLYISTLIYIYVWLKTQDPHERKHVSMSILLSRISSSTHFPAYPTITFFSNSWIKIFIYTVYFFHSTYCFLVIMNGRHSNKHGSKAIVFCHASL